MIPESAGTTYRFCAPAYASRTFSVPKHGARGGAGILFVFAAVIFLLVGMLIYALSELNSVATLSAFSTDLSSRSPAQLHNIRLAASKINGRTLKPGEEFSFNRALGPCGVDGGYERAPAIVAGEMRPEWGGGICQVSSTLYNAALLAGLKITERHAHSRAVRSVPPGRDAAAAFGIADLRFVNNTSSRVRVTAGVTGKRLTVRMLGARKSECRFEVRTRVIRAPRAYGRGGRYDSARQGDTVSTYRIITPRDGEPRQELISKDVYEVER